MAKEESADKIRPGFPYVLLSPYSLESWEDIKDAKELWRTIHQH